MVHPISSSDSSSVSPQRESPQERQKYFEIQFETALLSIFISVSGHNGSLKRQLSQIKNGVASKASPNELATNLNSLISQINQTAGPEKAPFPTFQFTSDGSEAKGIANFAIALEKTLNCAAENGKVGWKEEEHLFQNITHFIPQIGQLTPPQSFGKLNEIIADANRILPPEYQIPHLGGPS